LWLEPGAVSMRLDCLAGRISQSLGDLVVPDKKPRFLAHTTLARQVRPLSEGVEVVIDPILWRVDGFSLVESTTLPTGVEYQVLATWPADN